MPSAEFLSEDIRKGTRGVKGGFGQKKTPARVGAGGCVRPWFRLSEAEADPQSDAEVRVAALQALEALKDGKLTEATTLALADASDVDKAVLSADRAFQSWRLTTPAERTRLPLAVRSADLVEDREHR